jgi:hypothetical protein
MNTQPSGQGLPENQECPNQATQVGRAESAEGYPAIVAAQFRLLRKLADHVVEAMRADRDTKSKKPPP